MLRRCRACRTCYEDATSILRDVSALEVPRLCARYKFILHYITKKLLPWNLRRTIDHNTLPKPEGRQCFFSPFRREVVVSHIHSLHTPRYPVPRRVALTQRETSLVARNVTLTSITQ